jgi:hypothetical protein
VATHLRLDDGNNTQSGRAFDWRDSREIRDDICSRNICAIYAFRRIELEIVRLWINTNEQTVGKREITRDFRAIRQRNELKMRV